MKKMGKEPEGDKKCWENGEEEDKNTKEEGEDELARADLPVRCNLTCR